MSSIEKKTRTIGNSLALPNVTQSDAVTMKKKTIGERLTLPNGVTLTDAAIVQWSDMKESFEPSFNPTEVFQTLSNVPTQDPSVPIDFCSDGMTPIQITGKHPALHYRGNALKRHKVWLQSDYQQGLLKYGYTGWQHAIALATRDIRCIPVVKQMLDWLNENIQDICVNKLGITAPSSTARFNHVIFTRYANAQDCLGLHQDKEGDFVENSYFVILKLGASREFIFSTNEKPVEQHVFYRQVLDAGTLLFVRAKATSPDNKTDVTASTLSSCKDEIDTPVRASESQTADDLPQNDNKTNSKIDLAANARVKHGVPVSPVECGESGSLVFRCIRTVVPWAKVQANIISSEKQKVKRKLKKQAVQLNVRKKKKKQ